MQLLEELVFNHTAFWFGGGETLERSIPPFALRAIYGVCPVNRYSSYTHPATLYRSQRPKSHPALNASGANPSEIPSTPKQDLQDSGSESVQEEGVTGGGAFFYYLSPPPPMAANEVFFPTSPCFLLALASKNKTPSHKGPTRY